MDDSYPEDFGPSHAIDRRRALIMGAATCASGLVLTPALVHSAAAAGSVGDLRGEATAEAAGNKRDLKVAANVFVDETITTSPQARLLLMLGQRTTLRLGGAAKLRIDNYLLDAGGELELVNGAIQFERKGKPATTDLKVRSAYGLITVRGTRFFAGPSNNVFGVFVAHGRVDVSGGGKTVSVAAGEGTNIARPGAQPSTPAKWSDARIKAAMSSVMP